MTPIPGPKPLDPTEQLGHFDLPVSEDEFQLEIRVTAETYSLFIDGELTEEKPMDTLSRVNIAFGTTFDSVSGPITVERMPPGDEEQSK
ncbi:MAG: hypothetical protein NXI04_13765 [Planctomycetaceae bacterium]|nr:hypothetical protein [Planctomycetaceae bacterium]